MAFLYALHEWNHAATSANWSTGTCQFPYLNTEQTYKPESRQNSIPLISQSTSQTRKQPDDPQPQAKGKQVSTPSTAQSKQGRGEIYISQSGPRHSGLDKSKQ